MFRRRRRPEPDWFTCPVCGAQVRVGALACKECGSDDATGWSEATAYDDLDLPEPPDGAPAEVPDTFEDFERLTRRAFSFPRWAVVAIGLVLVVAIALASARPW